MTRRMLNRLTVPIACLSLAGCVGGLLGGGKPAQLFRFGSARATTPAAAPLSAAAQVVALSPVQFAPEIEGDRILAAEGAQVFYIKGSRWISPAPVLFEQSLRDAFRLRAPSVQLADRRSGLAADQALQIAIERFEAVYPEPGAAPTIIIDARVSLVDGKARTTTAGTSFHETQLAAANDIHSIVAAFDAASDRAVADIADWTRAAPPVPCRGSTAPPCPRR